LQCQNSYPIINGLPVVIDEDKSVFKFKHFYDQRNLFFDISKKGSVKARISALLPSISLNRVSKSNFTYIEKCLIGLKSKPFVLILGGSIIGEGMSEFLNSPYIEVIESDVSFGPRTQLILDAHQIPFADQTFDCVIAQAVLEHVLDPVKCVEEIFRVLKPGGIVYTEIPFMQQVHGGAYDFTRYTMSGHRRLLRKFKEIKAGAIAGPGSALAWSYVYFLFSLFGYTENLRLFLKVFGRITGFWLKYFDYIASLNKRSIDGASATFFLGTKSDQVFTEEEVIKYYK